MRQWSSRGGVALKPPFGRPGFIFGRLLWPGFILGHWRQGMRRPISPGLLAPRLMGTCPPSELCSSPGRAPPALQVLGRVSSGIGRVFPGRSPSRCRGRVLCPAVGIRSLRGNAHIAGRILTSLPLVWVAPGGCGRGLRQPVARKGHVPPAVCLFSGFRPHLMSLGREAWLPLARALPSCPGA